MSAVNELYQQTILDHNQKPRNFGKLSQPDGYAEGYNPLCGDRYTVYLHMQDDRVKEISFHGSGCAISKASASMMTASVAGKTRQEIGDLAERFRHLVTGHEVDVEELGKLEVFAGVSEFPARVKCATLAWHTLQAALDHKSEPVSTEEPTRE